MPVCVYISEQHCTDCTGGVPAVYLSFYTREADRKRERAEVAAATQHTIYTYVRYIFLAAHYTRTADNTHYIYACVLYARGRALHT